MKSARKELEEKGKAAKAASRKLAFVATGVKNKALLNIADALIEKLNDILIAKKIDGDIGISTQKFHARGPMALKELTSYKWIVRGSGQVRP